MVVYRPAPEAGVSKWRFKTRLFDILRGFANFFFCKNINLTWLGFFKLTKSFKGLIVKRGLFY